MTGKLYMHGYIIAETGAETEDQCTARVIAALELVKGISIAQRMPHMVAHDMPGEISMSLFMEQGTDLVEAENAIARIPGVKYQDLSTDLVRGPAQQNNPRCGQPGHQCGCPTQKPTIKPE